VRTGVEKGEAGEALQSVVRQVRHGWVHVTYLAKLDYLSLGIALYMVVRLIYVYDGVGERQESLERRRVVDVIDSPTFTTLTMTLSLAYPPYFRFT